MIGLGVRYSKGELELVAHAQAAVDFRIHLPISVPFGYRLVNINTVQHARDFAIMLFRGHRHKSFRLTERLATLPLITELVASGTAYDTIRFQNRDWVVIGGEYVGEPVDVWHWHATRRLISWEQDGLICEIGTLRDEGPSLRQCLRIASGAIPAISADHTVPVGEGG